MNRQLPCGCTLDGRFFCDDHRPPAPREAGSVPSAIALLLLVGMIAVWAAILSS